MARVLKRRLSTNESLKFEWCPAFSLQRVSDFLLQVAILMIVNELAERGLVEVLQHVAQLGALGLTCRERLSINRAKRGKRGVAMLLADLAVLVAVATVQAVLFHWLLPASPGAAV